MKSKLIWTIILIFTLGISSVYTQSSEIRIFESKREKFQKLVRAYQDSLADLDYLISELKAGNSVDYSETLFYNRLKTKNENIPTKLSNDSTYDLGNPRNVSGTSKTKSQSYLTQKTTTKSKKPLTSSSTRNNSSKVQTKKYRRRVGAICKDGTRSYATGRGACSHHGGVRNWLVE